MDTYAQIKSDRISAMKAGENLRKEALVLILAAIKQVEVDTRKELSEEDVIQILTKMVKQRQESITQFNKAGREDLSIKEKYEKGIIDSYLPKQLSDDEVLALVQEHISNLGVKKLSDMGRVMASLKPILMGRANMSTVSNIVKTSLS